MEAQLMAGSTAMVALAPGLPEVWRAVADHLWQSTVFVLVLLPAAFLLQRAPARLRYSLSLVASLKFALPAAFLLPLILRLLPSTSGTLLELPNLRAAVGGWVSHLPLLAWIETALSQMPELALAATLVWLAGTVASMGHWWYRTRTFARSLAQGREVGSGPLLELAAQLRCRLGLRQPVRLVLMEGDFEPGVFGAFRPTVVLPEGMPARLSSGEIEAVLLHELTHIKRRDNLVASLHMGLCALFWFYPLVWWLDRRLLAEREEACDEQVLAFGGGAKAYARGLLKAAGLGSEPPLAGVSTASASNFRLRIERILSMPRQPKASWGHRLALASTLPMLLLFSVLAGHRPEVQLATAEPASLRPLSRVAASAVGSSCDREAAPSRVAAAKPEVAEKPGRCLKSGKSAKPKTSAPPPPSRVILARRGYTGETRRLAPEPSANETVVAEPAAPAAPTYVHRD